MMFTLAMTKLKSHWVIKAAAMVSDRTWLGYAGQYYIPPMVSSSSDTHSALSTQNERNRTPSERVEHHKQVDTHDRKCRVAIEGLTFDDWVYSLVDADVEHGKGLSGAANDKTPLSS